jgi:hypothetical protein
MRLIPLLLALTACNPAITPESQSVLPRPSVAAEDGGWPSTGITRMPNGNWIVGHDGRRFDGDKVYATRLVILPPDKSRIVGEIDLKAILPGIESVQGLAWANGGVWIGDLTGKAVHHIVDGQVMTSIPLGFKVNGVASDGQRLYVGAYDDPTIRVIEGRSIVRSFDLDRTPDQLHFAYRYLFASDGENGQNGRVSAWNPRTGQIVTVFDNLDGAQAIEGIFLDGDRMTVISDGGFHREANPAQSLALTYRIKLPPHGT